VTTTATATSPAGTYPITASGAVDGDYAMAYVGGSLAIARASSTTSLTSTPDPANGGQAVTFVASVALVAPGAGLATGTVTFTDGNATLGSVAVDGTGTATLMTAALAAGTHLVTAFYGGDANVGGSTSNAISQVVNNVVQTASIADLIAKVTALNLNAGQRNSLIAKLRAAQASLARGNTTAAANQLGAFVNEVHADEQSGALTLPAGDPLIAEAQAIVAGF
jgi:Bacterial Ig-like domain (group 3)/MBG domain (YGX type)